MSIPGNILLVAADPVHNFRQDDADLAAKDIS